MKRERIRPKGNLGARLGDQVIAVFDIVNGFLIDAVAHGATGLRTGGAMRHLQMYIWLRLSSAPIPALALCRPVVDGVDSQA